MCDYIAGMTDRFAIRTSESALNGQPTATGEMKTLRSMSKDQRIRTPFQGEFLVAKTQAWKAWAMVSNRFAARQLRFPF